MFAIVLAGALWLSAPPAVGPLADQVLSAVAGNPAEEHGLVFYDAELGRGPVAAKLHDRMAWQTDHAANLNYVHFYTPDDFWREGGGPVRVTVTYFDEGTDGFAVKYRSTDHSVGADAPETREHFKTNSLEWKQTTFLIPDAAIHQGQRWVFWLTSNAWLENGGEDTFSAVEVRMGGITIGPLNTWCSADPNEAVELTVTAVPGPGFEVDQTKDDVALTSNAGFIEATAHLDDGQALVYFVPPTEPGAAEVTAKLNDLEVSSYLTILPGNGPVERHLGPRLLFSDYDPVHVSGEATAVAAKLADVADNPLTTQPMKLYYRYENPDNGSARAIVPLWIELPGVPVSVTLLYKSDASSNRLWMIFGDASGQGFYLPIGGLYRDEWRLQTWSFTNITRHAGGNDDGRWQCPTMARELRILNGVSRAKAAEGEIYLGAVQFEVAASKSDWAAWKAKHPDWSCDPIEARMPEPKPRRPMPTP